MKTTLSENRSPLLRSEELRDRERDLHRSRSCPATRQQEPPPPTGGPLPRGANVSGMTSLPGMVAL